MGMFVTWISILEPCSTNIAVLLKDMEAHFIPQLLLQLDGFHLSVLYVDFQEGKLTDQDPGNAARS